MRLFAIALTCIGLAASACHAEVLQIPLSQQGDSNIPRPGKGMSKAEVEKLFGTPLQQQGPVGQPPISRWVYADYVVTFEYDHVVHTVLKHKPKVPTTNQNESDQGDAPTEPASTEPVPSP